MIFPHSKNVIVEKTISSWCRNPDGSQIPRQSRGLTVVPSSTGRSALAWITAAVAARAIRRFIPLSRRLRELPLRVSRLKTGTPPRIDARRLDFTSWASKTAIIRCRSSPSWRGAAGTLARCRARHRFR
ncbi:hypothetical protein ACNKHQ_22045 [Shigella flexneri]